MHIYPYLYFGPCFQVARQHRDMCIIPLTDDMWNAFSNMLFNALDTVCQGCSKANVCRKKMRQTLQQMRNI